MGFPVISPFSYGFSHHIFHLRGLVVNHLRLGRCRGRRQREARGQRAEAAGAGRIAGRRAAGGRVPRGWVAWAFRAMAGEIGAITLS